MAVLGTAQAIRNIRRLTREAKDAFVTQTRENAEELLSDAIDLAPQKTNALIESGLVKFIKQGDDRFFFIVGFDIIYAVRRHEEISVPGDITAGKPGAGRKFLSRPYNKKRKLFEKRTKNAIERRLRQVSAQLPGT